jgi:hypothetical protein
MMRCLTLLALSLATTDNVYVLGFSSISRPPATTTTITRSGASIANKAGNKHHAAPAFVPQLSTALSMMPMDMDVANFMETATTAASTLPFTDVGSQLTLAFADQGQNLAGIFFQASLLPYIAFLYFIGFRGNRTPALGNFGFQFLLLFVFMTIPSGIISKANYGTSLANVDWLHGGAEGLLTVTNLLIVFGFRKASSDPEKNEDLDNKLKLAALALFGTVAAFTFTGATSLGFGEHTAFLSGIGNLPTSLVESFSFVSTSQVTHERKHSVAYLLCFGILVSLSLTLAHVLFSSLLYVHPCTHIILTVRTYVNKAPYGTCQCVEYPHVGHPLLVGH